jgi:hypothetical protein
MRFASELLPRHSLSRLGAFGLIAAVFLACAICVLADSGRALRGTVAEASGTPIHNASVILDAGNNKMFTTETDDAGRFEFAGLASGVYQLHVQSPGFATKTIVDLYIDHEGALVLSLLLDATTDSDCFDPDEHSDSVYYEKGASHGAHLGGEINLPLDDITEKEALEEATVSLYRKGEDRAVQSQHPDKNGKFSFRDVDPGDYLLKVAYRDFLEAHSASFSVGSTGFVFVDLFLHKHARVAPCQ